LIVPAAKHTRFTKFTKEGREFIRLWSAANSDGIQNKLAERFGISVPVVYRVRKKLGLPDLHDYKNHSGKRKLYKRIRRLYVNKERSTIQIARLVRMCSQRVNLILREMGVDLEQHIHILEPEKDLFSDLLAEEKK